MTRTIKAIRTKEITIDECGIPTATDYLLPVENYNEKTIATARNRAIKKGKTILAGGEKVVVNTTMTDDEWMKHCTIESVENVTEGSKEGDNKGSTTNA